PGAEVNIVFRATVDTDLPADENTVSVQGTVSGANLTSFLTSDPDAAGTFEPTTTPVPTGDLSVTLESASDTAAPGDMLAYTVTVLNAGPDDADNVAVEVTLDEPLAFEGDSCGVG